MAEGAIGVEPGFASLGLPMAWLDALEQIVAIYRHGELALFGMPDVGQDADDLVKQRVAYPSVVAWTGFR